MYNWNYDPWTFSPYIVEGWQVWRLGLSILCQGNFKPRFIFVVRPTVLNSSSQKRSFSIFKREEFEDIRFVFLCGQKTIWNEAFLKCWCHLPVVSRPVYVAGFLSLWFVARILFTHGKSLLGNFRVINNPLEDSVLLFTASMAGKKPVTCEVPPSTPASANDFTARVFTHPKWPVFVAC